MKKTLLPSLLLPLFLAACAAPKVRYDLAQPGERAPRFQLAESMIMFNYAEQATDDRKGPNTAKMLITSVPVPIDTTTYTIAGTGELRNWGVRTELNATHREETLLLQEVGTQVTDNRKQIIADVATALSAGLGVLGAADVAGAPGLPRAPTGVAIGKLIGSPGCVGDAAARISCAQLKLDGGGVYANGKYEPYFADIVIAPRARNAVPLASISFPAHADAIFYSACRTVTIQLSNAATPALAGSAVLRVAEPGFVEWIGLPAKGKVTFGPSCGADVVSENAVLPSAMDVINASLAAAKTIKDALDNARSSGASK